MIIIVMLMCLCTSNNIMGNPNVEYTLINAMGGNNQNNGMSQYAMYMGANAGNDLAENALTISMLTGNQPDPNIGMYVLADEARNGNPRAQQLLDYQLVSSFMNNYVYNNGQTQQQQQSPLLQSVQYNQQQPNPTDYYTNQMNDFELLQAASVDSDSAQMAFETRMTNGNIKPMNRQEISLLAQSASMGNDYAKDLLQYQRQLNPSIFNSHSPILNREHINIAQEEQNFQNKANNNPQVNNNTPVNPSISPFANMSGTFQLLTAATMDSDAAQAALELGQRTASIPAMNAEEIALLSQSALLGNDYSKDMLEYQSIIHLINKANGRAMQQPQSQVTPNQMLQQVNPLSQATTGGVPGINLPSIDYSRINTMGLINQATLDNDAAKNILNYGMMTGGVKPMNFYELALLKTQTQGGNDYAKEMLTYQSNILGLPGLFNGNPVLQQGNPNVQSNVPAPGTASTSNANSSGASTSSTSTQSGINVLNISSQDLRGMYMMKGKTKNVAEFDMLNNLITSGQMLLSDLYMYATQRESQVAQDMIGVEVLSHATQGNLGGGAVLGAKYVKESDLAQDLIKYKAISSGIHSPNSNPVTQYAFASMLDVGVQDLMMYNLVPEMFQENASKNEGESPNAISSSPSSGNTSTSTNQIEQPPNAISSNQASENTSTNTNQTEQPPNAISSNQSSADVSSTSNSNQSNLPPTAAEGNSSSTPNLPPNASAGENSSTSISNTSNASETANSSDQVSNSAATTVTAIDTPVDVANDTSNSNNASSPPSTSTGVSTNNVPYSNSTPQLMIQMNDLRGIYLINGDLEKMASFDMINQLGHVDTASLVMMNNEVAEDMLHVQALQNLSRNLSPAATMAMLSTSDGIGQELMRYISMKHMAGGTGVVQAQNAANASGGNPVLQKPKPESSKKIYHPTGLENFDATDVHVKTARAHYYTLLYIVIGVIIGFVVGGSILLCKCRSSKKYEKLSSTKVDEHDKYTIVMDDVESVTGQESKLIKV